MCYKPDAVRKGVDVVDEAYSGDKGYGDKEPDVMEAEERWLGLSMMLHLSAMRKYTNSAARSRAVINKYLTSSHISVKIIQFDRLFYSTIPKCHFTTYYRCICRNLQQEDNFPYSLLFE